MSWLSLVPLPGTPRPRPWPHCSRLRGGLAHCPGSGLGPHVLTRPPRGTLCASLGPDAGQVGTAGAPPPGLSADNGAADQPSLGPPPAPRVTLRELPTKPRLRQGRGELSLRGPDAQADALGPARPEQARLRVSGCRQRPPQRRGCAPGPSAHAHTAPCNPFGDPASSIPVSGRGGGGTVPLSWGCPWATLGSIPRARPTKTLKHEGASHPPTLTKRHLWPSPGHAPHPAKAPTCALARTPARRARGCSRASLVRAAARCGEAPSPCLAAATRVRPAQRWLRGWVWGRRGREGVLEEPLPREAAAERATPE